jgi:hypothetical protein
MRSIANIRDGVSAVKKEAIKREPHKVEIQLTKKTKELTKVSDSKRKELSVLDHELESKKKEAQAAGEEVIKEAKAKAHTIITQAAQESAKAKSVRATADTLLTRAKELEQKALQSLESNETREKGIRDKEKYLEGVQKRVEASDTKRTQALTESNAILSELVSLTLASMKRIDAMRLIDDTDIPAITETLGTIINALSHKQLAQDAKEEHFDTMEMQLDEKQAILKETRKQLNNAIKSHGK